MQVSERDKKYVVTNELDMRIVNILTVFVLMMVLVSCGSDDGTEVCTDLSETIVGEWESSTLGNGSFEFQNGGTLIDSSDLLISGTSNGITLNDKTWAAIGNDSLKIRASEGSQFLEFTLKVASINCDLVTLEAFGTSFDLNRK